MCHINAIYGVVLLILLGKYPAVYSPLKASETAAYGISPMH